METTRTEKANPEMTKETVRNSESFNKLKHDLLRRSSSDQTAVNYANGILYLCRFLGMGPDEFIGRAKSSGLDIVATLQRFIDHLNIEKGKPPGTTRSYLAAAKKLLAASGVEADLKRLVVPRRRVRHRTRPFTGDEVEAILRHGDARSRAMVLFLASSGVRIGALPVLRLKHLESNAQPNAPVKMEVPGEASKTGAAYVTFITPEAHKALQAYHDFRKGKGERLSEESLVFVSRSLRPLNAKAVSWVLNRLILRADTRGTGKSRYDVSLSHGYRKFFRTQLDMAKVPVAAAEQMMGHDTGLIGTYARHTPEQLRAYYAEAMERLTFFGKKEAMSKLEMIREFARTVGIDPLRVRVERRGALAPEEEAEELRGMITERLELRRGRVATDGGGRYESRIVGQDGLTELINDGWEFMGSLDSDRYLVRRRVRSA